MNAESTSTALKALKDLKTGDAFLNYRLVKELGRGGFGSVLRGVKMGSSGLNPEDHVAIKILHPAHANQEKLVHRFHREAKLAKKMSHPHVVRIFDDGMADGIHYIVMELAEGKTLLQYLLEGNMDITAFVMPAFSSSSPDVGEAATITVEAPVKLDQTQTFQGEATIALSSPAKPKDQKPYTPNGASVDLAVTIMKQCASVLQSAKTVGLLHRDLKPENILIRKDKRGQVQSKILDFGLAKNLVDESLLLSVEGQAVGTPAYMSPEQFRGETLDIRSDLYSLGATFYTFVTLSKPFPGPAVKDFMEQILNQIEKPAHELNPLVDKRFSAILNRLMQKDPALRHQTPDELIEDLNRYTREEKPLKNYLQKKQSFLFPVLILAIVFVSLSILGIAGWWGWNKLSGKINTGSLLSTLTGKDATLPKINPIPLYPPPDLSKPLDTEETYFQEENQALSSTPPAVQTEKPPFPPLASFFNFKKLIHSQPPPPSLPSEPDHSESAATETPIAETPQPIPASNLEPEAPGPAPEQTSQQSEEPVKKEIPPSASTTLPPSTPPSTLPPTLPAVEEAQPTPPPADFASSPVPLEPGPETPAPPVEPKKETPSVVVGYTQDFTQGTIDKPVSQRVQDILKRRSENFMEKKAREE